MTDLRKAAEKVMKWLEATHHTAMTTYCDEAYEEHCNVEKELRQALAQPEQVSIEPPDYVEPVTYDYHEGWEKGFKDGVESVKNKKESTPSNVDPLLHGGDGNYIKQAQPEQEPVAWMEDSIEFYAKDHPTNSCTIPLYTAPPSKHEHPLDIYERAYFAGKKDGIDEAFAQHEKKWVGLIDKDFQYQQPAEILTMKYTEALLKERNT